MTPCRRREKSKLLGYALPFFLSASGCAASIPGSDASPGQRRCVVAVEPQMHLASFAPEAGLDEGVTSIFFAQMPEITTGDLVELRISGKNGRPQVEKLESSAEVCAGVTHSASHHHHPAAKP